LRSPVFSGQVNHKDTIELTGKWRGPRFSTMNTGKQEDYKVSKNACMTRKSPPL
jgi:hypothetical protein